jgi:hypothetical protein
VAASAAPVVIRKLLRPILRSRPVRILFVLVGPAVIIAIRQLGLPGAIPKAAVQFVGLSSIRFSSDGSRPYNAASIGIFCEKSMPMALPGSTEM